MWRLSVANLRANPVRFVSTILAVIIATGFLATALFLRDSLGASLRDSTKRQLAGVDAVLMPPGGVEETDEDGPGSVDTIPATLLQPVSRATGVRGAAGILTGSVDVLEDSGDDAVRSGTEGQLWIPIDTLNPFTVVEGRGPASAGEVTLDVRTAEEADVGLDGRVRLATATGEQTATVVGLTSFGSRDSSASGGDVLVSADDAFTWLGTGSERYTAIYVAGDDGVTEDALVSTLTPIAGTQAVVETGDWFRADQASQAAGITDAIGTGLQVFAYVALFVGIFIIYNTFTISVTQRIREFALLRAIGASTTQVSRAVRVESLLVGVIASAIGVLAGAALVTLALQLDAVRQIAGGAEVSLRLSLSPVLQVVISGTLVTVISAMVPAYRAARTKPIEAMRLSSVDRGGASRARGLIGGILVGVGALLVVVASFASVPLLFLPGVPILFLGTIVAGPLVAHAFAGIIGAPFGRRTTSHLAVENTRRNATRTATTANALVIGVFLVVFVTAAGGALRDYVVDLASGFAGPDLTVTAEAGTSIPDGVQQQLAATDGVSAAKPAISEVASYDNAPVGATDLDGFDAFVQTTNGSYADVGPDEVAMAELMADGIALGDPIQIVLADGSSRTVRVAALMETTFSLPPVIMPIGTATALEPDAPIDAVLLKTDGADLAEMEDRVDRVISGYSNLSVIPGNFIAVLIKSLFNGLIASVNVLLGVAIVIAVFGIVNTLILSVTERTHEIGLLRAVGMTRPQLRTMIRTEAVIVALIGTVVGATMGLFVAWSLTRPIFGGGGFSWPVQPLLLIMLGGLAVGLLASVVPAWRASRLNALEAIATE